MDNSRKLAAEFIGTFWLVLGGCGSAVLAAGVPDVGIGYAGVALAFGLTVLTGAYAFGHISGGHFNPAVTFGLFAAGPLSGEGRHSLLDRAGARRIWRPARCSISSRAARRASMRQRRLRLERLWRAFAARLLDDGGRGLRDRDDLHVPDRHPGRDVAKSSRPGFAPLAIGLALTLIHLISIPVTNTSVNPARSTGVAIFQGGWAIEQLWFFWVAPLIGGGLAGFAQRWLRGEDRTAVQPRCNCCLPFGGARPSMRRGRRRG